MAEMNPRKAAEVLQKLDELGAINLDVLLGQASEVNRALAGLDVEPGEFGICYPFTMHIGPHFGDIVQVASQVEQLGYKLVRVAEAPGLGG